jgi:hypothetical protein
VIEYVKIKLKELFMLTKEDIDRIISKSNYWKEIRNREGGLEIAKWEFVAEYNILGIFRMLEILEDYARILKKQSDEIK